MKIIKDKNLIGHRISLQALLLQEVGDFANFIGELQERMKKFPLNREEITILYKKIVRICNLYFELAFGNYFMNQQPAFKQRIYEKIVSNYTKVIFDQSITDIQEKVVTQIYVDMENTLKEEIKTQKQKNG